MFRYEVPHPLVMDSLSSSPSSCIFPPPEPPYPAQVPKAKWGLGLVWRQVGHVVQTQAKSPLVSPPLSWTYT